MDSGQTASRAAKKKKEKKGGRFVIRIFCGILGVAIVAVGIAEAITGFLGIKKIFNNLGKSDEDKQISEIFETLPLDQDGVISITFPVIDRTNRDSVAKGFVPHTLDENGNLIKVELNPIENENANSSVVDYEKTNGTNIGDNFTPSGYLGIQEDYAYYLEVVKDMKAKIVARDESVTSALMPIEYDVPNLYLLPSGYQLYCDDQSLFNLAKVAELHEDGSIVYSIPAYVSNKFVGVKEEVCTLIVQYDTLEGQMIERYFYYYGDANTALGENHEPQNNMGR